MAMQRGPGEGYMAAKDEVRKLMPESVCCRKESICDIKGYVVYPTKEDADNDTNGYASAATARDAWNNALNKLKRAT